MSGTQMVAVFRRALGSGSRIRLRSLFSYVGVTTVAQIIQMVASVVVLRWVEPAEAGIWASMLVMESYASVLRLGVINGMNRRYPLLLGRGEKAKAEEYVAVTLFHTLLVASVMAFGALAIAVFATGQSWPWRASWVVLAVFAPANLYCGFIEATARGSNNFQKLGWIGLARSLFGAASIPLVMAWSYTGFCARIVLMAAFAVVVFHRFRPVVVAPRFDWTLLRGLWKDGVPLFLSSYGLRVAQSVGSVTLFAVGGTFGLGTFAPVSALLATVALIPDAIVSYFVPQQHFDYGKTQAHKPIIRRSVSFAVAMFLVSLPIAGMGVLTVGPALNLLLPKYVAVEHAMQVAILLGCVRIIAIAGTAFGTLGVWRVMLANQAFFYVMQALMVVVGALIYKDNPWFGVVLGMLVAQSINVVQVLLKLRNLSLLERIA